jgi:hypothetical protein
MLLCRGKTHKTVNNKRFESQMSNDENGIYVEKASPEQLGIGPTDQEPRENY